MVTPVEPLVVLGIVVNADNHVLLVRRRDTERWIFPGGQTEPGESQSETVVREVREETGVQCEAIYAIGGRTHPESNRKMVYWFCKSLSDLVSIEDVGEIAEARWVKREESVSLLGGSIFAPVRKILTAAT